MFSSLDIAQELREGKQGAVSPEARLLVARVNKAFQGKCSSGSFLPVLVFPLFILFSSTTMFIFSLFPLPSSPPSSVCATACFNLCIWTGFSHSSLWVLAEWKPDGPAVPTVISQPTLASLPVASFLGMTEVFAFI